METSVFIDKVSDRITELGLTTPAILLLETHKPFAVIGSQLLLIAQPVLDVFLPQHLIRNTSDLLADPNQLEQLISKLEMNITPAPTSDQVAE